MNNSATVKQMLSATYRYRIELHAHTHPVSGCSEVSPEELVEIYNKKRYDGIVVTNHFKLQNGEKDAVLNGYMADYEAAKLAGEKCGMKVILGAEIKFTENSSEYLMYGVNREVLSVCYDYLDKGVEIFRREVRLPESVFIQAHPFRNGMVLCNPEILDGIETFNMHPHHNSRVGVAARYAAESGVDIKIAGSDFHHPNIGHEAVSALRCKTLPADSFELAQLLKKGDYIFEIGENSLVIM